MGNFGVLASRYNANARLLKEFDEAITFFKKPNHDQREINTETKKLLTVLEPIKETNHAKLSNSLVLDASEVVSILQQRHLCSWQTYQNCLQNVTKKLVNQDVNLTNDEFEVLNDVADALETHCTQLFKRMGEG